MIGQRPPPTRSWYQRHGPGFHGSPDEPSTRRLERSWRVTKSSPERISARIAVGAMPITLTRWRSTMSQMRSGPGKSGVPS
jgi:hypothetical protein